MSWGSWGKRWDTASMTHLIDEYVGLGISSFDHADIYGGYSTEREWGDAFAKAGTHRNQIQLISKCGIQYLSPGRDNRVKHYQYDSQYIIDSAYASLKNLGTDYLDVFLMHRPSPLMHPAEVAAAVETLQKQGAIIDFGVSNFEPHQVDLIASAVPVTTNQIELSLNQWSTLNAARLDHALQYNYTVMAWSPMGNYGVKQDMAHIRLSNELDDLAEKYACTPHQLLIAWLAKLPCAPIPVLGTTTPRRALESLAAMDIALSDEDWFALLIAMQGHKVP